MGEVIRISEYQSKSTMLRAHARAHNIPLIDLPPMQPIAAGDVVGLPRFTAADRALIDECETIFLEHQLATGVDLRDPDGADWMLDERDI